MGKGRIIGKPNDPTPTVASGVWSLTEQLLAKKGNTWIPIIPISIIYNEISSATTATHTFTGVNFGPSRGDRIIGVISHYRSGGSITHSSASIGGISATIATSRPATTVGSAIFYANVPSGDSGSVSITMSSTVTQRSITIFSFYPSTSNISVSGNNNGLTGTPASITTTVTTGVGGCIAAGVRRGGGTPTLSTSSGYNLVDEERFSMSTEQYHNAVFDPTTSSGTETITGSGPATGTMTLVAAAFYW